MGDNIKESIVHILLKDSDILTKSLMHVSGLNNGFKLETTDVSCTTNHQLAMLMRKAGNDCRTKWNQQG